MIVVKTKPVSRRTLIARINRKLAEKGQRLCASRSNAARGEVGDYYVGRMNGSGRIRRRVDIEALGRKLGVLAEGETLAEK
jgi:hypothetical protein